ncbi:MAG TPA: Rieske (2Fe-2S) protein, partial [Acidimicrobiales bacterium]|nr:Rieske (2Fe-2S) protein [Acidimicrobiales bacterium]
MGSRYPFPSVPDGWFSICASDDLATGQPATFEYLNRELVAFRAGDGRVRVFDAYCPHLGAHLGYGGRVCDDGIVCPFHGWRFDGTGRLVEVPRLEGRPPPISAATWETCERNGRVFIWHHAG